MKTHYTVALAMLAGAAIGATAVNGLHAQAKAPLYLVSEIDVTNPEATERSTLRNLRPSSRQPAVAS